MSPTSTISYAEKHHIPVEYVPALNNLQGHRIVVIADNSGSMGDGKYPHWQNLKSLVFKIQELAQLLPDTDLDLAFFKELREGRFQGEYYVEVKSPEDIQECFKEKPHGGTPLIRTLNDAIKNYENNPIHKKLVLYIATDGVNQEHGTDTPGAMKTWVKKLASNKFFRENISIHILLLTDKKKVIDEYTCVDHYKGHKGKTLKIDVTSPMSIEKERFKKINPEKEYTEGVELAKILVGLDSKSDDADETDDADPQLAAGGCCVIS